MTCVETVIKMLLLKFWKNSMRKILKFHIESSDDGCGLRTQQRSSLKILRIHFSAWLKFIFITGK